jgi:hypothetical protein
LDKLPQKSQILKQKYLEKIENRIPFNYLIVKIVNSLGDNGFLVLDLTIYFAILSMKNQNIKVVTRNP